MTGRILEFPDANPALRQDERSGQSQRTAGPALPESRPASSVVMAVAGCLEAILTNFDPVIDIVDQPQTRQLLRSKIENARREIFLARHNALLLDSALDA